MRTLLFLAALFVPGSLFAQCTGSQKVASSETLHAEYVVYMPTPITCFNGNVVMFAHGYVPQGAPVGTWLSQLALPDGTSLPGLLNSLGFGFAASGFSKDGLAIPEGAADTKALATVIQNLHIPVQRYFITGASEGSLIAAKLMEADTFFSGGVAVCGPVGDFRKQLNYVGDVRVLFDYFFPNVLPGNVINPSGAIAAWPAYEIAIRNAVNSKPLQTLQLLSVANIPIGLNASNAADAIVDVLWYDVFGFADASLTLGGNFYDNYGRVYRGSFNDARLNALVPRFGGNPSLAANPAYNTTGQLKNPLVTLHTLADPIVPYDHETLYGAKVAAAGQSSKLVQLPSLRYGHCNVSANEAKVAVLLMLLKAGI
jgi:hypothetical protein